MTACKPRRAPWWSQCLLFASSVMVSLAVYYWFTLPWLRAGKVNWSDVGAVIGRTL